MFAEVAFGEHHGSLGPGMRLELGLGKLLERSDGVGTLAGANQGLSLGHFILGAEGHRQGKCQNKGK